MQGAVRPSSSIRWLVPLSAIRNRVVFLSGGGSGGSQGVRRLTAEEVETRFDAWFVRTGASDVLLFDLFFSHRWDWNDKSFVRKLVDLLAQYTTGDNPPRAIVSFLDVDSLEDGLNFQESFVGALVHTRLMVEVVSWAALERMKNPDPAGVDNVLVEWICALRLLHLKQIHVMPVFFGKRTDANGVGGNFFERDAATGMSMLQLLPDVVAEATLAKAVELMTKAEVWTSGSPVEPSAFGLSSLSVCAIVTAMTSQMGVQACDSKNPAELLRLCADKITAILAKGSAVGGGGDVVGSPLKGPSPLSGGVGASSLTPAVTPPVLAAATTTTPTTAVATSPFDAAWSVLQGTPMHTDRYPYILYIHIHIHTSIHAYIHKRSYLPHTTLLTYLSHNFYHNFPTHPLLSLISPLYPFLFSPLYFSFVALLLALSAMTELVFPCLALPCRADADPDAYLDFAQLQRHLQDFGITGAPLLEYLDNDNDNDSNDGQTTMVAAIVACLKPIRRKQFMTMLAKAKATA